jgi:hypothetical protein
MGYRLMTLREVAREAIEGKMSDDVRFTVGLNLKTIVHLQTKIAILEEWLWEGLVRMVCEPMIRLLQTPRPLDC